MAETNTTRRLRRKTWATLKLRTMARQLRRLPTRKNEITSFSPNNPNPTTPKSSPRRDAGAGQRDAGTQTGRVLAKIHAAAGHSRVTATGVGIAAIKFKDKDERLRAISETIDAAAKDPRVCVGARNQAGRFVGAGHSDGRKRSQAEPAPKRGE